MPATLVRAGYDTLSQSADTFAQQANQARKILQQLASQTEAVPGGDWHGQGARSRLPKTP